MRDTELIRRLALLLLPDGAPPVPPKFCEATSRCVAAMQELANLVIGTAGVPPSDNFCSACRTWDCQCNAAGVSGTPKADVSTIDTDEGGSRG